VSQPTGPRATESPPSLSLKETVLMVAALVVSVISFQMNGTMLTPAIHAINTEFGDTAYGSMSTFFALAGAVSCIALIRWSDYVGRKRVLLGITIVLCVGTVLCIVATSLEILVLGRILQGTANITFGLAFLILRERLSLAAFGTCCGVITSINGGVAGVDTLLAGFMTDRWGYRSIFVLSLVVGVVGILFVWRSIPADQPERAVGGRMDWWGAALLALAVTAILMFVRVGGSEGWSAASALSWIAVGTAALVAFVIVDSRIPHPLVAIEHMRSRETWPVIATTILCMGSLMLVAIFIVPSIAEDTDAGFAASATKTALLFVAPAAIIQLAAAPIAGRIGVRIGFVAVLRAGIVGSLLITALLAVFAQQESLVIALTFLLGITLFGVLLTALSALGVVQSPEDEPGALPGISNASFGIGISLGFAWAAPVVGAGTEASFQGAFWICAVIGVIALVFSLILKPKPGALDPAIGGTRPH
jgi:predicted MFS family arabinose efflux permease